MFRITARTVLELGAELISSDIIAFYELIKNAFDAKSPTGAEIDFRIVLRRNAYLRLRDGAELADATGAAQSSDELSAELERLKDATILELEPDAREDAVEAFKQRIAAAGSLSSFVSALDASYADFNEIVIRDTGTGMSLGELRDCYLTIGTASRKRDIEKALANQEKKAPFLGEKGIGRLSAMRLGEWLRVESARDTDVNLNTLEIDWKAFEDIEAMVEDVVIEPAVGQEKPSPTWSGTTLTIRDLSEDWTSNRVKSMADHDFARLADPYRDAKSRPRIALAWNGARVAIPSIGSALLAAAHAKFAGTYEITPTGPELRITMEARNLGYDHPKETDQVVLTEPDLHGLILGPSEQIPTSALTSVGAFTFEGYWYNRRQLGRIDAIGNQEAVRQLQRQWSGIMLFRDGFRVFPYGDDADDWLGLDRKALARTGYVLNKAQFLGRVEISRTGNPGLVDQTNREGLRATPEQAVLVSVLQIATRDLLYQFFKDVDRRHRRAPESLEKIKEEVVSLEARAKSALTKVRRLVPKQEAELVDDLDRAFVEFKEVAERAKERAEQVEADSKQMMHMAGIGLMVEVVAHELARATEATLHALESLKGRDFPPAAKAKLETLKSEIKSISKRLRVLDHMSVSGRQRAEVFDLGALLDDIKEGHEAQFHRHRIQMAIHKPDAAVNVRVVKGMVIQILENLISNSVYWLQLKVGASASFVPTISITLHRDPLRIVYADNGPGISVAHRDRVFNPYWSLKDKAKRRGLGLFIARENAKFIGGALDLDETVEAGGRLNTFVFELPETGLAK